MRKENLGICRLCGQEKQIYAKACCHACYLWERYQIDPDYRNRQLKSYKKWREKNPDYFKSDRYKERQKLWRIENREQLTANARKRRHLDPEKSRAASRRYRQRHPERVKASRKKAYEKTRQHQTILRAAGLPDSEVGIHPWRRANEISYQEHVAKQKINPYKEISE